MNQINDDNINNWQNETSDAASGWTDMTGAENASGPAEDISEAVSDQNSLQKATILLLLACAMGVGAMFLLKMRVKPKEISEDQKAIEVQVDLALQKLSDQNQQAKTQDLFKDTSDMIQLFYDYPANQQVALEELQRDPFARQGSAKDEKTGDVDNRHNQDQLRKELEKQLASFRLQSVLQGSKGNKCMINGQIYSQGQLLENTFTISVITENSVKVTASGMEFELMM